jgi:hypothetical protein
LSLTGEQRTEDTLFWGMTRDTISLRRARLQPDTIRTLMLVKKRLHLRNARAKAAQAARPLRR